jgi:ankyrin repeat protein
MGVPLETSDKWGNTALHWAARADQTAIIELLIRHGKSSLQRPIRLTELCNQNGDTPLHVAVIEGHYDAVHTLIQCGSSLNRQNLDGLTPLHAAVLIGNTFTCSHYFMDCEIDY